jgi:hypothetical protein
MTKGDITMGFWDDYATAVQFYPETNVELEIVDVDPENGDSINEGEEGTFTIQISNNGPLTLTDVEFEVRALNGMRVAHETGHHPWKEVLPSNGFVSIDVVEHNQTIKSQHGFRFKAPGDPQPVRDLIEVSLAGWNADPGHIHTNHTGSLPNVKAVLRDRIARQ